MFKEKLLACVSNGTFIFTELKRDNSNNYYLQINTAIEIKSLVSVIVHNLNFNDIFVSTATQLYSSKSDFIIY